MTTLTTRIGRVGLTLATLASLGLAATGAQAQTAFKAGDIVVSRVGDGSATLSSAGTAIFLDEYTTSGTLVQSIAVPSTGAAALVSSGTATSEGQLALSTNGQFLTIGGYNAPAGTASIAASTVSRGVAEIGTNGVVNTTTLFTDSAYSGNNIRSAASTDGNTIYTTGTGTATSGGVRSATFGNGSTTQLENAVLNTRVTNIANGNLYFSTSTGTGTGTAGIYSMGALGSLTTPSLLIPTATLSGSTSSPYDFYFASPTTVYVADDRTTAAGGLQQYTITGGSATLTNTFNLAATAGGGVLAGLRGLTGNGTDLFGISTDSQLVDFNLASGTFRTVATSITNEAFRGVDFAPAAAPAAVPEASTTISFGLLLALGLGGIVVARRRKQA